MSNNVFVFTEPVEFPSIKLHIIVDYQVLNFLADIFFNKRFRLLKGREHFIFMLQIICPRLLEKSSIKVNIYLAPPFDKIGAGPQRLEWM